METLRGKKGFICDMDGVIYHGNRLLPGVKEFVAWLYRENKNFLFLTNSSEHSPKELQRKLERMGLEVDESHFYTSALATARFISSQAPGCSAYVIGGAGLIMALHDEGITMNDIDPDYVIIGEGTEGTDSYEHNRNLQLTDDTRVDSVPNLEIFTGEVQGAGHASASGRLDDIHLFYLCSRGIPAEEARRLIIRGYFLDIVNRIDDEDLRDHVMEKVERKLAAHE